MLNILIFLGALFFGALICHQALAQSRPHESRLTEFYLLIAGGGVLGGAFNSLLAPIVFSTVLEFPLMLVLVCLARPLGAGRPTRNQWLIAGAGIAAAFATGYVSSNHLVRADVAILLLAVAGTVLAALVYRQPFLFTAVIAALVIQSTSLAPNNSPHLATVRSFFGVLHVTSIRDTKLGASHILTHGTTIHGSQALMPALRCIPTTYYAPQSPIGETILNMQRRNPALNIGVVGLGSGTLSAYTRASDKLRYFEIDPAVARIARDPQYFTYLSQCAKGKVDVVLGDARLTLGKESGQKFDLIILDAFSSDNIPTHLLTREAFALYFHVLKPAGVVLLHISNRNLSLEAPTAATARAAGAKARIRLFETPKNSETLAVARTEAVLMAKSETTLAPLTKGPGWRPADDRGIRPWTDEYTNVVGALYDHAVHHLP